MWKLSLFILYATALFALASADLHFPLNTCILTVRSTVGKVVDPHSLVTYGILNRFATSDPPVNRLTIAGGGTSDVFKEIGIGLYSVGFSVKSDKYGAWELKDIVTHQWADTNLFERDVGSTGNWRILSVNC